jgi:hypothetical protein
MSSGFGLSAGCEAPFGASEKAQRTVNVINPRHINKKGKEIEIACESYDLYLGGDAFYLARQGVCSKKFSNLDNSIGSYVFRVK